MSTHKRRTMLALAPVVAVTMGCLMAQQDMDELVADEAEFRAELTESTLMLEVVETGSPTHEWDPIINEYAHMEQIEDALAEHAGGTVSLEELWTFYIDNEFLELADVIDVVGPNDAENSREAAEGFFRDRIDSIILQGKLDVLFGVDEVGDVDACTIEIAEGAAALMDHGVSLRTFDTASGNTLSAIPERPSAEACEEAGGVGFYFNADAEGVEHSMSMCAASCDAVQSALGEGTVLVEVVITEG